MASRWAIQSSAFANAARSDRTLSFASASGCAAACRVAVLNITRRLSIGPAIRSTSRTAPDTAANAIHGAKSLSPQTVEGSPFRRSGRQWPRAGSQSACQATWSPHAHLNAEGGSTPRGARPSRPCNPPQLALRLPNDFAVSRPGRRIVAPGCNGPSAQAITARVAGQASAATNDKQDRLQAEAPRAAIYAGFAVVSAESGGAPVDPAHACGTEPPLDAASTRHRRPGPCRTKHPSAVRRGTERGGRPAMRRVIRAVPYVKPV